MNEVTDAEIDAALARGEAARLGEPRRPPKPPLPAPTVQRVDARADPPDTRLSG